MKNEKAKEGKGLKRLMITLKAIAILPKPFEYNSKSWRLTTDS